MSFWNRLRLFRIFFQLVRDPNRTELIFNGVNIVSRDPENAHLKVIEQTVLAHEEFKTMFETDYMPEPPCLEQLKTLPPGSFGQALYQHMVNHNLSFELFPREHEKNTVQYLSARIYQDHDLWHVLLGYGITVEEELAIQAFGVAQFGSPIGTMLVAGGLLHLLWKNPNQAVQALRKINDGYTIGRNARFLLGIHIHDHLPKPLKEVRKICGVA